MDEMKKIISEMNKRLNTDIQENEYPISEGDTNTKSYPISYENFRQIYPKSSGKILFVDGGNSEIFGSFDFSIHFARIAGMVFQENNRISLEIREFFILVNSLCENEQIYFETKIYPLKNSKGHIITSGFDGQSFLFNSMDPEFKDGIYRANISKFAEIARRINEIKLGIDMIEKCKIVVLDGSLRTSHLVEQETLHKLFKEGLKNDVSICSVAKTSRIYTSSGRSIIDSLNSFNFPGSWLYTNVFDINNPKHRAEIGFARLHSKSSHLFRIEVFKEQKERILDISECLSENSRDCSFPGYPYGLIQADFFARVSDYEKNYLQAKFQSSAGSEWKKFKNSLSSIDAHDFLDNFR